MHVSAKLLPLVLVPVIVVLALVVRRSLHLQRQDHDERARALSSATLGVWLVVLIAVTTTGRSAQPFRYFELIPFNFSEPLSTRLPEILVNALMFAPLGVLTPFVVRARTVTFVAVTALVLSTGIELLQYWTANGRSADVTDILLNTSGAIIAVLVTRAMLPRVHHEHIAPTTTRT